MKELFKRLVVVNMKDEDLNRRGFILNVILLGFFILIGAAFLNNLIALGIDPSNYEGAPIWILAAVYFLVLGLYKISRSGFINLAGYLLIIILLLPTAYTAFVWGPLVPQALLTFALIIVMSGIIINKRAAFLATLSISLFFITLAYLQERSLYHPDLSWIVYDVGDIIVALITLFVITLISWLSNREIEKSLKRAHKSEKALKKERDSLEAKVEKRTEELKKAQEEKLGQLYRFSEFGRVASGIFHDLMNPLTALSLNLQEIKKADDKEIDTIKEHLQDAFQANSKMQEYMGSIRQQLNHKGAKKKFSLEKSIEGAVKILALKASDKNVKIEFEAKGDRALFGDPNKFQRVITNLTANAIDSYKKDNIAEKRKVLVSLVATGRQAIIEVADEGEGIDKKDLQHIFEPFYTTKKGHEGMGIGLSISKDTIENEFGGAIEVSSKKGKGTTFVIKIPIKIQKGSITKASVK